MRAWMRSASQLLTPRTWLLCTFVVLIVAAPFLTRGPQVDATQGVDDYPPRLKRAALNALVDPWLFYNRECTSFVAWRLNNDAGVRFHNYYLGEHWGNASNWAAAARQAGVLVDEVPKQGSVAWWRAGSIGSSRGHVAWVRSVSPGEISIEEYNYPSPGLYNSRTISSTSAWWPSAFIHIGDLSLRNTTRPTIEGGSQVGERLEAIRGTWTPGASEFAYQWLANGVAIKDATGKGFRPTADQLGKRIQVRVVASKPGLGSRTATSAMTGKTKLGVFTTTKTQPSVAPPRSAGRLPPRQARGDRTPPSSTAGTREASRCREPTKPPSRRRPNSSTSRSGSRSRRPTLDSGPPPRWSLKTPAVAPGTFVNNEPPTIDGFAQVGTRLTATAGDWTPHGTPSYQWFADGEPLRGATARWYTPDADDVRRKVRVEVTVTRNGYTTASKASAATDEVVPGTFINTRDAAITGKPQVGVPLTADPGGWSPRARFDFQWYAGADPVAHATHKTYTPGPDEVGKKITLEVTASRPGYLTAVVNSAPTKDVVPGIIENEAVPTINGVAIVDGEVTANPGSWSPTPETTTYQWRIDGVPIDGATDRTYTPTARDGAHKLTVKITVTAPGYETATSTSEAVVVLRGQSAFAHKPHLHGRAVVGNVLTVGTGAFEPSNAHVTYEWFRGDQRIRGAEGSTYELRDRDLGERIYVRVTLSARNWLPATRSTNRSDIVRLP